jgi:hypothetical protein
VAGEAIQNQINDLIGRGIAAANERLATGEVAEDVAAFV